MSGFSYPEWIGDFYPEKTKREQMLAHYATRFRAVEINMTFRRDAPESTFSKWRDAVDDGFRFALKAHMRITHMKRLVDVADDVRSFLEPARALGERLGPILFQVRPSQKFDADVLDAFGASLPAGPQYAFEPRDASFASDEADDILKRHGIARCLNDDLFDPRSYRVTAPFAYFRFHRDTYTPEDITERVEIVRRIADEGTEVYAFFAHEDNPDSVRPALVLQEALR